MSETMTKMTLLARIQSLERALKASEERNTTIWAEVLELRKVVEAAEKIVGQCDPPSRGRIAAFVDLRSAIRKWRLLP